MLSLFLALARFIVGAEVTALIKVFATKEIKVALKKLTKIFISKVAPKEIIKILNIMGKQFRDQAFSNGMLYLPEELRKEFEAKTTTIERKEEILQSLGKRLREPADGEKPEYETFRPKEYEHKFVVVDPEHNIHYVFFFPYPIKTQGQLTILTLRGTGMYSFYDFSTAKWYQFKEQPDFGHYFWTWFWETYLNRKPHKIRQPQSITRKIAKKAGRRILNRIKPYREYKRVKSVYNKIKRVRTAYVKLQKKRNT